MTHSQQQSFSEMKSERDSIQHNWNTHRVVLVRNEEAVLP